MAPLPGFEFNEASPVKSFGFEYNTENNGEIDSASGDLFIKRNYETIITPWYIFVTYRWDLVPLE